MKRTTLALAAALTLNGCMLGPNYSRPEVELPADYGAAAPAATALDEVPAEWWRLYQDETLAELVQSALTQNTDVALAAARLEEAEALLREAGAVLLPEVDVDASAARARSSAQVAPGVAVTRNDFRIGASTRFELDFWGRLRRLREAARAQYLGTRYARDVVALSLAAATTKSYFALRSLDAQIRVSEEVLRAAEESLAIVRARARAGVANDLEVSQAAGNRAQLAAQTKELRRLRAVTLHALGVLAGRLDLALPAGDLKTLPTPPLPPAGLPSSLLERRPDVRVAEAALMAASAEIGVARAERFPTFTLTGAIGLQSDDLSNLFESDADTRSAALGVLAPVLDWGRYRARSDQAEARARQAAAEYRRAVQEAFRETLDALSNVSLAAEADADLRERVEHAANGLALANQRYTSGYSAYLEVLDAQRTLNDAQLALARNREAFLGFTVDLMNALGGGWQPYDANTAATGARPAPAAEARGPTR